MPRIVNRHGLGFALDLSGWDRVLGVVDPYPATVNVFTDSGSFFHVVAGLMAGALGGVWALVVLTGYLGYEFSKVASGETWQREGGKFIEFGLGAALSQAVKRA